MNTTIIIHEEDVPRLGGTSIQNVIVKVIKDTTDPAEIVYVPGQRYLVMKRKLMIMLQKSKTLT